VRLILKKVKAGSAMALLFFIHFLWEFAWATGFTLLLKTTLLFGQHLGYTSRPHVYSGSYPLF
jgi:hypothetical protein